jgi:rhomboid protease GluP
MNSSISLTNIIIAINVALYIVCALVSGNFVDIDLNTLLNFGAINGLLVVLKGEWYRLFTAMFLHGGAMHIAMNMVSLYVVGKGVEFYFGKVAFGVLYLISGLFGGMLSIYMHTNSVGIGASGAIFGIFGAMIGFFVAHRQELGSRAKEIFKEFSAILGLNLFLGLSVSSIDMSAHIGGLIVGTLGGFIVAKYPKSLWIYSALMVVVMFIFGDILYSKYASLYL